MPEPEDYQPVACGFYDELGLRMMKGIPCRLLVEMGDTRESLKSTIDDLYTEGHAEYVRLDDGTTIRLDRILEVDDVQRDAP